MDIEMRAFVQVVARGNFTAAADDAGVTPSAISKLISRLEDRLGVQLLHRTTRRISLTPEGEMFYLRAREILHAIEDAEAEVSEAGQSPRGRLRVNCATGFAFHELAREVPAFLQRHPDVQIELAVTDRIVDLIAENFDVGIRSGRVVDPSLVSRKIVDYERRLFAAPAYLERHGMPVAPDDLVEHACIIHSGRSGQQWPFLIDGQVVQVPMSSRLRVDNAETALCIALAGGGIAKLADTLVGDAVRSRRLVAVLPAFHASDPVPLSAVYPHGKHRMPKVRAFLDFLIECFAGAPWRCADVEQRPAIGRTAEKARR